MTDILIVEDDVRHSGLINIFLRDGDYHVVGTATNGSEAMSLILDREPDLVILDLRMPKVDGVKVMRMIEALGLGIPVIISTAVTNEEIIAELKQLGAADYLLKPYSGEDLLESIDRHTAVT